MLRDAAITWATANCPDPNLRADFVRQLDGALKDGVNCWFVVGREMVRRRVPCLVHCFAGELFVFELTEGQAQSLGTPTNGLGFSRDPHPLSLIPKERSFVLLSEFELDRPVLSATDPIQGSCRYAIPDEVPAAVCLRLDYSLGRLGNLISWNYPEQILSRAGRFRLDFAPLAAAAPPRVQAYQGPAMMFLRVCTLPFGADDSTRQPLSNACAALVEFRSRSGSQGRATTAP